MDPPERAFVQTSQGRTTPQFAVLIETQGNLGIATLWNEMRSSMAESVTT
ncbi:hypothetical protein H8B02_40495 [Bradyrhizobium sp. Pear77]|nr:MULTISPECIES: hypothetical protein [Bradyrhizobium]MCC8959463.1 hypothetical protein [Bradyrhizobium altum]MCC8963712.1 hypothetical protein [Bradyrhizobium oropedii]